MQDVLRATVQQERLYIDGKAEGNFSLFSSKALATWQVDEDLFSSF